jgi:hypothetical protein
VEILLVVKLKLERFIRISKVEILLVCEVEIREIYIGLFDFTLNL